MSDPIAPPAPVLSPDGRLFWDGAHWQPLPAAGAAPAGRTAGLVVLAGSGAVAVGTLLPYATATGAFGISLSRAGVQTDGIFVLLTVVLPIILAAANLVRRPPNVGAVGFTLIGGISQAVVLFLVWMEIAGSGAGLTDIVVEVGIGVYVSGIGAITTIVGALMAGSALNRTAAPQEMKQSAVSTPAAPTETEPAPPL